MFSYDVLLTRLESECQFEQAAAIAVFNLKLTRAISALQNGATFRDKKSTGRLFGVISCV